MRHIETIYALYLQSIKGEEVMDIKVEKRDIEILEKAQNNIKPNMFVIKQESPKTGYLYMLGNLFFVINDASQHPYEIFICSNFWELATDKDIIIQSKSKDTWALESIIRYIDEDTLNQATHIDEIDEKYLNIMRDYLYNDIDLPKNIVGMKATPNSFQEKFRKHEIKRSMALTIDSLFYEEEANTPSTITINIKETELEKNIINKHKHSMAAASYEKFIQTKFGEMIKKDKVITIKFDEQYAGLIAKLYANNKEIFFGTLPKRLNIETNIDKLEILKENLEIEFL